MRAFTPEEAYAFAARVQGGQATLPEILAAGARHQKVLRELQRVYDEECVRAKVEAEAGADTKARDLELLKAGQHLQGAWGYDTQVRTMLAQMEPAAPGLSGIPLLGAATLATLARNIVALVALVVGTAYSFRFFATTFHETARGLVWIGLAAVAGLIVYAYRHELLGMIAERGPTKSVRSGAERAASRLP